ncbi:MAG: hypothetical protein GC165_08350 [Armatimonadetes bacterium]|nr:hypothetical protein [Armatimonadota bacterium]
MANQPLSVEPPPTAQGVWIGYERNGKRVGWRFTRTKRPHRILLYEFGLALVVLAIFYTLLSRPGVAYTGPYPAEAEAYSWVKSVQHFMIVGPPFFVGLLCMFVARCRQWKARRATNRAKLSSP